MTVKSGEADLGGFLRLKTGRLTEADFAKDDDDDKKEDSKEDRKVIEDEPRLV